MGRRSMDEGSRRLILLHLLAAAVVSFLGTFTLVLVLEPSRFFLVVIMVGLPVIVTTTAVKSLVASLDDEDL